MPDGLVHESEEKLRAHFFAHGTPSATGLLAAVLTAPRLSISLRVTSPRRIAAIVIVKLIISA